MKKLTYCQQLDHFLISLLFLAFSLYCPSHTIAADFAGKLKGTTVTDSASTNRPPVAMINFTTQGATYNFDASSSSDSDGTIVEYKWNFGDGNVGAGAAVSHQFGIGQFTVTLTAIDNNKGVSLTQAIVKVSNPVWLNASGTGHFSLLFADSQETVGENGAAANAFDKDQNTIWHTQWLPTAPPCPHEIQVDLGKIYLVDGFMYLPRQNGINGTIAQYEFFVSMDEHDWGASVSNGIFTHTSSRNEVFFSEKNGRYIRLVATTEVNGKPLTSAAEIDVHIK